LPLWRCGHDPLYRSEWLTRSKYGRLQPPVPPHLFQLVSAIERVGCIKREATTSPLSARQLEDIGVADVTYPRILTAPAIKGMQYAFGALRESLESGAVIDRPDLLVTFDDINNLMGLPQLHELKGRYLSAADRERKCGPRASERPSSASD